MQHARQHAGLADDAADLIRRVPDLWSLVLDPELPDDDLGLALLALAEAAPPVPRGAVDGLVHRVAHARADELNTPMLLPGWPAPLHALLVALGPDHLPGTPSVGRDAAALALGLLPADPESLAAALAPAALAGEPGPAPLDPATWRRALLSAEAPISTRWLIHLWDPADAVALLTRHHLRAGESEAVLTHLETVPTQVLVEAAGSLLDRPDQAERCVLALHRRGDDRPDLDRLVQFSSWLRSGSDGLPEGTDPLVSWLRTISPERAVAALAHALTTVDGSDAPFPVLHALPHPQIVARALERLATWTERPPEGLAVAAAGLAALGPDALPTLASAWDRTRLPHVRDTLSRAVLTILADAHPTPEGADHVLQVRGWTTDERPNTVFERAIRPAFARLLARLPTARAEAALLGEIHVHEPGVERALSLVRAIPTPRVLAAVAEVLQYDLVNLPPEVDAALAPALEGLPELADHAAALLRDPPGRGHALLWVAAGAERFEQAATAAGVHLHAIDRARLACQAAALLDPDGPTLPVELQSEGRSATIQLPLAVVGDAHHPLAAMLDGVTVLDGPEGL